MSSPAKKYMDAFSRKEGPCGVRENTAVVFDKDPMRTMYFLRDHGSFRLIYSAFAQQLR